ncbi:MAG: thiamine ABC transporter substrate-binding protein [Limnochordales bacterium]|nr:thiamine ABC transporter substrate-binding protein [Limnochordales bacterium]
MSVSSILKSRRGLCCRAAARVVALRIAHFFALVVLAAALAWVWAGVKPAPGAAAAKPRLVVYTYDSFVSWGPAKEIEKRFEAQEDVDLVWVAPGDSGEMFARLLGELQAGRPGADVFVGLADSDLPAALQHNVFQTLDFSRLPNLADVPERLLIDPSRRLVPLDHGFITLVYDSRVIPPDKAPKTFNDLLKPEWRRKIIAINPVTSSPGMAFLLWTIARFGEDGYLDFWRKLKPNLLTVAGGWSEAYSMFENGEAPIVVSYSTDMAYGVINYGSTHYRIITLDGQGYEQIELMGIVRGRTPEQARLAHAFINFMLSPEVQGMIPTTNWMFPANSKAKLPADFVKYAVTPAQPVRVPAEKVAANREKWLREWSLLMRAGD